MTSVSPSPVNAPTRRKISRVFVIVAMVAATLGLSVPRTHAVEAVVVEDDMSRSVGSGLGTTSTGVSWSTSSPGAFSVGGGVASMRLARPGTWVQAILDSPDQRDITASMSLSFADRPTAGSGYYTGLKLRQDDNGDSYLARLRYTPDGWVHLAMAHHSGRNGATTVLAGEQRLARIQPGQWLTLQARASGTSPTRLSVRAWPTNVPRPDDWQLDTTHNNATQLTAPGTPGIWAYSSGSSTGATTITTDNILVNDGDARPVEAVVVEDDMSRSVGSGLGTTSTGVSWSTSSPGAFSVGGGVASMRLARPGTWVQAILDSPDQRDITASMSLSFADRPTAGSGYYTGLKLRQDDNGDSYLARLRYTPDGWVHLAMAYHSGRNGATTVLAGEQRLARIQPGQWLTLQARASRHLTYPAQRTSLAHQRPPTRRLAT